MYKVLREFIGTELEQIFNTAQLAHLDQFRRSGEPYIEHPIAVSKIVDRFYSGNIFLQKIALLHDSFEDAIKMGNVEDEDELMAMIADAAKDVNEARKIINVVIMLTHASSQPYDSYVTTLANNSDALRVKLADMLHNLQSSPSDRQRAKYQNALIQLKSIFSGKPPAISSDHWNALTAEAGL